jgi:hypothetical protein
LVKVKVAEKFARETCDDFRRGFSFLEGDPEQMNHGALPCSEKVNC